MESNLSKLLWAKEETEEGEEKGDEDKNVEKLKSSNVELLGRLTQEFSKMSEGLVVLTQDMDLVKEQLQQIVDQIQGLTRCSCNLNFKVDAFDPGSTIEVL